MGRRFNPMWRRIRINPKPTAEMGRRIRINPKPTAEMGRKIRINPKPTLAEIGSLEKALTRILQKDSKKLVAGVDYSLDLLSSLPHQQLIINLDKQKIRRGSYAAFRNVIKKYRKGEKEEVEAKNFIRHICKTKVMKYVFKYLKVKGKFTDMKEFGNDLFRIWFGTNSTSCCFKHVYYGDVDSSNKKYSGLHSFLTLYLEQKAGHIMYLKARAAVTSNTMSVGLKRLFKLRFQLTRNGISYEKPVTSLFFGMSPHAEIGLLSLCYYCQANVTTEYQIGPYKVQIIVKKDQVNNLPITIYPIPR